jgi:hypothetical protein
MTVPSVFNTTDHRLINENPSRAIYEVQNARSPVSATLGVLNAKMNKNFGFEVCRQGV